MGIDECDLNQILELSCDDFLKLRNSKIFITGGTGYIGKWILESLMFANQELDLNIEVTILTRNSYKFFNDYPHLLANDTVNLLEGDIRNFEFINRKFTHAIHGATDIILSNTELENFDVIVNGTKRFLEFCKLCDVKNALLLSSGSVYGKVGIQNNYISEKDFGLIDTAEPSIAYGLGKLVSEWLGSAYSQDSYMSCKYARIFAQIGPYLALDKHFAIGNFINDVINHRDIIIKGDGKTIRSYMYGVDLVVWLIAILIRGERSSAYNVGSDQAIDLKELANKVLKVGRKNNTLKVQILGYNIKTSNASFYVPNTLKATEQLGLSLSVPIEDAIERTFRWYDRRCH